MKTSTITEVKWVKKRQKEWQDPVWFYSLAMENWDLINIWKKTENYFQLNAEVKYEDWEKDEYGIIKTKEVKEQTWWFKPSYQRNPKVDFISFAMSYTKDLIVWWKADYKDLEKTFTEVYTIMIATYELNK